MTISALLFGRSPAAVKLAALTVTVPLVLAGAPASARTGAGPGQSLRWREHSTAGIISAFAGGVGGPGPATAVAIADPCGVAYAAGQVYFTDRPLRKVNARTGWLSTLAGDTVQTIGPVGDGGPATRAYLSSCGSPAVDPAGNLVVPDTGNSRVRAVAASTGRFYGQQMTAQHIYTVAGTGQLGLTTGGVPATKAQLCFLGSVTVDGAGNLVLADAGSRFLQIPALVQVVAVKTGSFYGQRMTAGDIYNIAGESGLRVSGDGGPALTAGLGVNIGQVELDSMGNVVIADESANTIRVIAGKTGTMYGRPMTAGDIYRVAGTGTAGYSGAAGPATKAELNQAGGVAVDGAGNLVVGDTRNHRVRVVAERTGTMYGQTMTAGDIYTVAGGGTGGTGDGGPATSAKLDSPSGIGFDGAGNPIVADNGGHRVRLVAVATGEFYRQKMKAGDIYTIAGNGTLQFSGDRGPATKAVLDGPGGMAFGGSGDLAVSDTMNNRLRLVPVRPGTYFGQKMTAGRIYTIAGDGRCRFTGTLGDGGPAVKATVCQPAGMTFDGAGNLLFADNIDNLVRVVAARSGTFYGVKMTADDIYAVAGNGGWGFSGDGGPALKAKLGQPEDVAVDRAGNLVIADFTNDRVRVVATRSGSFYGIKMTAGDIYTVAGDGTAGFSGDGGPAVKARFNLPDSVAVDGAGNILADDMINNRIRVVAAKSGTFYGVKMTAGDLYTVAGSGPPGVTGIGFSGDRGPATKARLGRPQGVRTGPAGNLLIGDTWNNRVRVVAAKSGTFYGMKMTAGDIYTVAGNGKLGFSGLGGPALDAELLAPTEVIADSAGNLFFGTDRVEEVSG